MSNIYYNPGEYGLTVLATIDDAGDYEFHKLVAWQENATGKVYYAWDSGCSCPTPFEDFTEVATLEPLNAHTRVDFFNKVKEWNCSSDTLARFTRTVCTAAGLRD